MKRKRNIVMCALTDEQLEYVEHLSKIFGTRSASIRKLIEDAMREAPKGN